MAKFRLLLYFPLVPSVTKGFTMRKWFTEHPASVGETYFAHMWTAFSFAARLFLAGVACLIHGLLPFCFTNTGSSTVKRLHQEMIEARGRRRL